MFIDDVVGARSRRVNWEVDKAVLTAQIQTNAAKMTGYRFTLQMDNEAKTFFNT